ncbi:MAG: hypothetical protein RIR51_698 [Bacteroidota bacterium]|jgi:glycine cleavage system H protein
MSFPKDLKYSEEHEWIRVEGDTGVVGISDHAQSQLGDIIFVDVNTLGEEISQNEVFGSVDAVKTASDLFLPISGEIIEINSQLESNPELVNNDPYGEGWIIKIKIKDSSELESLMDADSYQNFVG